MSELINKSTGLMYNQPDSAEMLLEQALTLTTNNNLRFLEAEVYRAQAGLSYITAEYPSSLLASQKALEIYRELEHELGIAQVSNILGLIYQMQGKTEQAIEFHNESIVFAEDLNDLVLLAKNYFNLGIVYDHSQEFETSLAMLDTAEFYALQTLPNPILLRISGRRAEVLFHLGEYEKSLDVNQEVLAMEPSKWDETFAYSGIAKTLLAMGKNEEALEAAQKSYDIALELNANWEKQRAAEIIANIYASMGQYDLAYEFHQKFKSHSDTLFNEQKEQELNYLQLQQELFKNEALANEVDLQKQIISRKNLFIALVIAGGLIFLVLAVSLYQARKEQELLIGSLKKKNDKIEQQANTISQNNQQLQNINKTKDQLLSVISHDIRSPLASVQSILLLFDKGEIDRATQDQLLKDLSKQVDVVSEMLTTLLYWAKSQMAGIHPKPEPVSITGAIREQIIFWSDLASKKGVTIGEAPLTIAKAMVDREHIRIVMRNLVGNALKFTPSGGTISFDVKMESDAVSVLVKDNGIGMSQEKLDNLFKEFGHNVQEYGTDNEPGTGIGLILCKQFIEKAGGKIEALSQKGKGSIFMVTLPLA
ncbi:tetratricopeptide repeat-containing sensor histidine kinase [Peijinzhouia sedimentorum]